MSQDSCDPWRACVLCTVLYMYMYSFLHHTYRCRLACTCARFVSTSLHHGPPSPTVRAAPCCTGGKHSCMPNQLLYRLRTLLHCPPLLYRRGTLLHGPPSAVQAGNTPALAAPYCTWLPGGCRMQHSCTDSPLLYMAALGAARGATFLHWPPLTVHGCAGDCRGSNTLALAAPCCTLLPGGNAPACNAWAAPPFCCGRSLNLKPCRAAGRSCYYVINRTIECFYFVYFS